MAKKSMLAREVKRQKLCKRYSEKRALLKKRVIDPDLSMEERLEAVMDLQKLPRDSNPNRQRNRCALTGRPRGYYRRFGLGRNKLREVIMKGEAPGATKASW
ncbi:MAG: 30S ribosomal protein S14 [Gammaproteobacteria bacterium]|nr:30S ribosomal protein S14 [Gammaproteobacteria bacterium]MYD78664.1 30S ribosomal protein S14 [Gammaproteobacteria bacterium]